MQQIIRTNNGKRSRISKSIKEKHTRKLSQEINNGTVINLNPKVCLVVNFYRSWGLIFVGLK